MYRRRVCFQTLSEFDVPSQGVAEWKVLKILECSENRPFSCTKNQLVCFENRYPTKL
jgi:hypothetical protein